MNIDFIKWMCDKAKWDITLMKDGTVYYGYDNWHLNIKSDLFISAFYPLLLQRAIEGVNKENDSGKRILEVVGMHSQRYLKYGRMCNIIDLGKTDIDKAKESALMYIYEQETKK